MTSGKGNPLRRAACSECPAYESTTTMLPTEPTMKIFMMRGTISVNPVSRRPPAATSPHPMVIAPSPTSPHPDITRCGAGWDCLNDRRRHRRWDDNRGRGHYNRGWNRESEVETDTNPCIYRSDSQSRQGQNC